MPEVEQEQILVTWIAPTRPVRPVGQKVPAVPAVIAILLTVIMIAAGEWMAIAVIVALMFAYYMWATVKPDEAEYKLSNFGLRLGGRLYRWTDMARWWEEDKWGWKLLAIDVPDERMHRVTLVMENTKVEDIKKVLEKYLLMEKPPETTLDRMGKWLQEKFPLAE